MCKRLSVSLIAAALLELAVGVSVAGAQAREIVREDVTLRGTVEAVDYGARTVIIRGPQGNFVTLDVPPSAVRFDQVKVGDTVIVSYYDRVNLRLKPAGEAAVDSRVDAATLSPGATPGGTLSAQRIATVTITGWDPATRVVSYTGPRGNSYSRHVSETVASSVLSGLKVGDRVDVTWTEAVTLSVESPSGAARAAPAAAAAGAAAAVPELLIHKLTFSALWGLDNQFTGKVIVPVSSSTPGGVPISTMETTYDQVYGSMGLFKAGVGYRTSPRSEVVVNLVFEKSGSQAVTIGHVGTENAPIVAKLDDYFYWGFEGGQRFYFARVRFTPYVGYTVGLNRISAINGTFEAPATASQPGFAVANAPFFDAHWAPSFGPIGGVLVGLGPFEVQAELGLRFTNGLSDVNSLVNVGLKDINVDSARWSIPVLFGARIRF